MSPGQRGAREGGATSLATSPTAAGASGYFTEEGRQPPLAAGSRPAQQYAEDTEGQYVCQASYPSPRHSLKVRSTFDDS